MPNHFHFILLYYFICSILLKSLPRPVCGCTFTGLNSFTWHEKGCAKGKKRLAGALSRAREAYRNKKARIQESTASDQVADQLAESSQQVQGENVISYQAEDHESLIGGTEAGRVCGRYFGQYCY